LAISGILVSILIFLITRIDKLEESKSKKIVESLLKRPLLNDIKGFVNRQPIIQDIYSKVSSGRVINLHGKKGAGKSEVLKVVVDISNGNNLIEFKKHLSLNLKTHKNHIAVYMEFPPEETDFPNSIGKSLGMEQCESIELIAKYLENSFSNTSFVFVIDNIITSSSHSTISRYINQLLRFRPQDTVVLGSVFKFQEHVLDTVSIEITGFEDKYAREYCERVCDLRDEKLISAVIESSQSLPVYMKIFGKSINSIANESYIVDSLNPEVVIQNHIYPNLSDPAKKILISIACYCLFSSSFPYGKYNKLGRYEHELNQFGLLIINKDEVKIHDLLRDSIVSIFRDEVIEECAILSKLFLEKDDLSKFLFFALIGGTKEWNKAIKALEKKADENDNIFLDKCWDFRYIRPIYPYPERVDTYLRFCHVRSLMSQGRYSDAKILAEELTNALQMPIRWENNDSVSLQYCLADIDHLLNNYEVAKEAALTIAYNITSKTTNFLPKSLWLAAHCSAHCAKNIEEAKDLFIQAEKQSVKYKIIRTRVISINGQVVLGLMTDASTSEMEFMIKKAIGLIYNNQEYLAERSSLLRTWSRIKLKDVDLFTAGNLASESLDISYELASRGIHDSMHCVADIERAKGNLEKAVSLYEQVKEVGEKSKDINLETTAFFGIVVSSIVKNECLGSLNSWSEFEDKLLDIEIRSMEVGISINQIRAKLFRALIPSTNEKLRLSFMLELEPQFLSKKCNQEIELFKNSFPKDSLQLMDIQNV